MRIKIISPAFMACACLSLFGPATGGSALAAWTNTTLYQFSNTNVGDQPGGGVVRDAQGSLYGSTIFGGYPLSGTIFKVTAQGKASVVHTFCNLYNVHGHCADGAYPSSVILDAAGALYGTAEYGGPADMGTVYKLVPNTGAAGWKFIKLHDFSGPDGGNVMAGLTIDANGVLYGTTETRGAHGAGTLFRLVPSTSHSSGYAFQVLHQFAGGADGAGPRSNVAVDSAGNLYGTTYLGGLGPCGGSETPTCGTLFKVAPPAGGHTAWTHTVIYSFAPGKGSAFPAGGANPAAAPTLGPDGVLYGTASLGGPENMGVIFRLTPPAAGKGPWTETVLRNLTYAVEGNGASGGVTLQGGSLYAGTASGSGAASCGSIFELSPPSGSGTAWTVTVLHKFADHKDGCGPSGNPVFDATGAIYGMTGGYDNSLEGGNVEPGTVFKLTP